MPMQHPPLSKPRAGCAGAVLGHRLYIAGGCSGGQSSHTASHTNHCQPPANVLRSMECYDPLLDRWVLLKPMQWPRWGHVLVACEGKLYAVGGSYTRPSRAAAEEYDPTTNTWRSIPAPISGCRWSAACATDGEGHIVLMGGIDAKANMLASVEVYAVAGRTGQAHGWMEAPPLSSPRAGHACALVGGFLYCTGGRDENGYSTPVVERVDCQSPDSPAHWVWQRMPSLAEARFSHSAVCFNAGRDGPQLMVVGGLNEDGHLQSTECLRDRATGDWEYLDDLHQPRSGCVAVSYSGVKAGQVWVLGGGAAEPSTRVEIYERQKWRRCRVDTPRAIAEGGEFGPGLGTDPSSGPQVDDGTRAVPRRDGTMPEVDDGTGQDTSDRGRRRVRRSRRSSHGTTAMRMNREGQAYAMSHTQQDHDYLALHARQEMQEYFARSGETKVLFSAMVQKMNRKGKIQTRTICVTDVNIYNLDQKLKISWSKPLLAMKLAVVTPVLHGILFCFDGAAVGTAGDAGTDQVARENKGKLKKIKSVGKSKQFEYLLFGCETAEVAAALQEVVALNAPVEIPFLSCQSSTDFSGLQQVHNELRMAPLPLWFMQDSGAPQVTTQADAGAGLSAMNVAAAPAALGGPGFAQHPTHPALAPTQSQQQQHPMHFPAQSVQQQQQQQQPLQMQTQAQQYDGQRHPQQSMRMQHPTYGQQHQQHQQMHLQPHKMQMQMQPQGGNMYGQTSGVPGQQQHHYATALQQPQHMSTGNRWQQP